ncbi:MaoC family dehydratase [Niveispirillum sp.]|uniref:MaoC family dehydratase n=1 Tax=Niveispirillum sp. TaxID=1917217 RepID=UPI001B6C851B|nr:MaoC family dehydratase [Niveispirillum sp.]MBP7335281.1 MaoC family dehydratase [Niveispirillum sp.]
MSDWLARLQMDVGMTHRSDWLLVDQAMIDQFAAATMDRQFIHTDPERAAKTRFGGTIAHGFLILSLLPFLEEKASAARLPDIQMGVNYGLDRVRFVSPVRVGSRIRSASTVTAITEKYPGHFEQVQDIRVEVEGQERPAIIASWITHFLL